MAYEACGCWTGPWHGVQLPPICDYHKWANNEIGVGPIWNRAVTVTRRTITNAPDVTPADPTPDDAIKSLHAAILREAAAMIEAGNIAAHDAWQLALQHIEPLRAAIERAKEASK